MALWAIHQCILQIIFSSQEDNKVKGSLIYTIYVQWNRLLITWYKNSIRNSKNIKIWKHFYISNRHYSKWVEYWDINIAIGAMVLYCIKMVDTFLHISVVTFTLPSFLPSSSTKQCPLPCHMLHVSPQTPLYLFHVPMCTAWSKYQY